MKEEYYGIFNLLYNYYPDFFEQMKERGILVKHKIPFYSEIAIKIIQIIDNVFAEYKLGDRIRPDAKYFLLLNIHQMVCLPLLIYQKPFDEKLDDIAEQLESDIKADISKIAKYLSTISNRNYDSKYEEHISSHVILKALDSVWSDLKIISYDLWG